MASHGQSVKYVNRPRNTGLTRGLVKKIDHPIGGNVKYENEFLTQNRIEQIFSFYGLNNEYNHWYDEETEAVDSGVSIDNSYDDIPYEQLSFDLESIEEVEEKLRLMIRKYNQAIKVMGSFALLWHDLMEDIETIPNLKEEFDSFQMIRKMRGGTL